MAFMQGAEIITGLGRCDALQDAAAAMRWDMLVLCGDPDGDVGRWFPRGGTLANYLKTASDLPPASRGYNTSGRAYPDISAQATNFCVVPFGCSIAGTSCATRWRVYAART